MVTVVCESTKVAQVTTVTRTYFDSTKNENLEFIVKTNVISVFFCLPQFRRKIIAPQKPLHLPLIARN